jgi:hypothetical protein
MRCTSIESLHRNKQIPLINSNEKFCTESLLKQKMCSSKKHNHTSSDHSKSQLFSTSSLQKPRVYTYDDRHFPIQQQNIVSSSSGSSILSLKDKHLKEVGETRYIKDFLLSFFFHIFFLKFIFNPRWM